MSGASPSLALGGAMLAELLLQGRLRLDESGKRPMVEVEEARPTGDELLDECLEKVATASRRAHPQTWVSRFSALRSLKHRVAASLCRKGILLTEEDRVLLLFRRQRYPERNPAPERRILERLRRAVLSDDADLDARTVILVALCDATGLLKASFDRKELKASKPRIERIVAGELVGTATREAVQAVQAAVFVVCVMPAILSATGAH